MTNEEKQLLLIDLCARLPYGVIVQFEGWNPEKLLEANLRIDVYNGMGGLPIPYLRPMSSMTEEERDEYMNIDCGLNRYYWSHTERITDWINEHHFDYRGLIEKGLALEAKENMYKTE